VNKYSIFSIIKNAFSNHQNWSLAWKDPTPKKEYDVVIIGGGGHGLATAYYLAKEHQITNVAIIEKGWIGGGNIGRNTTIIRSNFMYDENAKFNEFGDEFMEKYVSRIKFQCHVFSKRNS
jgi:L-2-hydroxyglutarate oxidase LhgO